MKRNTLFRVEVTGYFGFRFVQEKANAYSLRLLSFQRGYLFKNSICDLSENPFNELDFARDFSSMESFLLTLNPRLLIFLLPILGGLATVISAPFIPSQRPFPITIQGVCFSLPTVGGEVSQTNVISDLEKQKQVFKKIFLIKTLI